MDYLSWVLGAAIIITLVAFAVCYFSTHLAAAALILLSISCLPLFFDPSTRTVTLFNLVGSSPESGVSNGAVHLSAFVVPPLALGYMLASVRKGRSSVIYGRGRILALTVLYTLSIIVGMFSGAGWVGLAFYVQTMLPILAFFSVLRPVPLQKVSTIIVSSSTVTIAVVLAVTAFRADGYGSVDALVSVIPQFRSYFSIVPTVGVAFAIAGWAQHRRLSLTFMILSSLAIPVMWSRAGLAMVGISAAVAFLARPGPVTRATKLLLGSVLALLLGLYAVTSIRAGVIGERDLSGSTAAASGASRTALALEAFGRVLSQPLLGDSFVPYSDVLAGGTQVDVARLFPAHNQYLDVALRGGVIALILVIMVIVGFGLRSFRLASSAPHQADARFHAGLLAVICAVALGNMTHLFLVQPWSGVLIFVLLGIGASSNSQFPRFGQTSGVSENPVTGRN